MRRSSVLVTCLVLAAAALTPVVAAATLVRPASVEELTRSSHAVVRGRVVAKSSRWIHGGTQIATEVVIETASVWHGDAPARVTIVVPGGVVGDMGHHVAGAPRFTIGEEVAVFLRDAGRARFKVSGMAMGKFELKDGQATPHLGELGFVRGELRAGERRVGPMSEAELEQRVRSVP